MNENWVSTKKEEEENVTKTMLSLNCLSKWMNVLMPLILLFYSNRLCILSPPTSFFTRPNRSLLYAILHTITFRLNSTITSKRLWVIRNCHCLEWRDTNIFPRVCRLLSIFYSFLHVRFKHKGLRSWFLFSFFFNVNRWHFIFVFLLFFPFRHSHQSVCLHYTIVLKQFSLEWPKCERWI